MNVHSIDETGAPTNVHSIDEIGAPMNVHSRDEWYPYNCMFYR